MGCFAASLVNEITGEFFASCIVIDYAEDKNRLEKAKRKIHRQFSAAWVDCGKLSSEWVAEHIADLGDFTDVILAISGKGDYVLKQEGLWIYWTSFNTGADEEIREWLSTFREGDGGHRVIDEEDL